MKKHLYIILLILPLIGFGQGWEQTFGGTSTDWGYSIQQTNDGGYIITGYTSSFGNGSTNVYLIKTDENGIEEWSQTYGGTISNFGYSVQQTIDGGYVITGYTSSFGNSSPDVYLIKTDENGEEQWYQTYGGTDYDWGQSVQQTLDGGYVVTGITEFGNGTSDVYLIKTDGNGNEEWSQTFGGMGLGMSVQQTIDGGYIITGNTGYGNVTIDSDVYLVKTDGNGNEEWSQTFGGMGSGMSVQQTIDGGYFIVGTDGIIKTDTNGNIEWVNELTDTLFLRDGGQTNDGGYIITGNTSIFGSGYYNDVDVYVIKTDENGVEEWSQTYGGTDDDRGNSVQQTNDGGYIITGIKNSVYPLPNNSGDVYLIKTDSQGNVTSTIELPRPTSKRELIKTTNILGQENTTIKNQPLIEIYDDGSTEKKIVIE